MGNKKFRVLEYTIYLSDSANSIIEKHIQNKKDIHESGGILLGQVKGNNIYIQKVTVPNKFDKSSRYEFIRDKNAAQVILDYELVNSLNTVTYLGEWHTHPENNPKPSSQDKKMIKEQFFLGKLNLPFVLLLIQGIEEKYISLYINRTLNIALEVR